MPEKQAHKVTDRIIAVVLTVAVFFLSLFGTTDRPFWGDDYAAYINEGIAIAEGRFEEQKKANFRSHPTEIKNEEAQKSGELTYVWGYPLLIAAVYAVCGYDTVSFDSMVWYRAISAGLFALLCGAFYLWCRGRFSRAGALVLAVFTGTCRVLYGSISSYYADIPFVALSVICFFLTERYLKANNGKGRMARGILLGATLFLTKEIRSNGFTVVLCCALAFLADALRNKEKTAREKLVGVLVPAAAFLIPLIVLEGFVFGSATSGDFSFCGFGMFWKNLRYAAYTLKDWIASSLIFRSSPATGLIGTVMKIAAYAFLAVAAVGCCGGLLKNEPHVALFLAGNLIGVSVLPYAIDQGGRYHYFLIPYTVLCFGYGVRLAVKLMKKAVCEKKPCVRIKPVLTAIPAVLYCVLAVAATVAVGKEPVTDKDCAYSDNAISMYRYIRENTDPDCTILTQKPRVLSLNTGRGCIAIANGHTASEADYLLDIDMTYASDTVPEELIASLDKEQVKKYGNLTLYRIKEAGEQ